MFPYLFPLASPSLPPFVLNHKPPSLGAYQESKQGVGVLAPGERKRPSSGSIF